MAQLAVGPIDTHQLLNNFQLVERRVYRFFSGASITMQGRHGNVRAQYPRGASNDIQFTECFVSKLASSPLSVLLEQPSRIGTAKRRTSTRREPRDFLRFGFIASLNADWNRCSKSIRQTRSLNAESL